MAKVQILHNPRCSKSRQTLALLEEKSVDVEQVLYLESTPTVDELKAIIAKLGVSVRDIIRTGEDAYKENGLSDKSIDDDALLAKMVEFPKLIQRPIVINGDKAAVGRPPESVLDIL